MPLVIAVVIIAALWLLGKSKGAAMPRPTAPTRGTAIAAAVSGVSDALDSIAEGIARNEGFYKSNSKPQRTNNPGMIGGDNSAGYADAGDGWEALQGYIASHAAQHPDWDFYDFAHYYLTGDTLGVGGPDQHPDKYAEDLANFVGADPTQTISSSLDGSNA